MNLPPVPPTPPSPPSATHTPPPLTAHPLPPDLRLPPNDMVAEQQAIGAVLLDGQYQGISAEAAMALPPHAFYLGHHRNIWRAIQECWDRDRQIPTAARLQGVLERNGAWNEEVRERIRLAVESVAGIANLPIYMARVRDVHARRTLHTACKQTLQLLDDGEPIEAAMRPLLHAGVVGA